MLRIRKTCLVLLPTFISLSLILSACVSSPQQSPQGEQRTYPTVFITPLITQIVATRPASTATPEGEPTQQQQIIAGSWDPYSVRVYYPITGCVASRLHIGDSAFVASDSGKMALYTSQDISFGPIARRVQASEALLIVDGPWCQDNMLVWKVKTTDKDETPVFVPEGNGEQYWLLPLQTNPGIPTPKSKRQAAQYGGAFKIRIKGCMRR